MKWYKPPCWLRICWPLNAEWPDEADYPRYASYHRSRGRPKFPERPKGAVPDRWIYDLFKCGMTNTEIGRRVGLSERQVCERLRQLEHLGYISRKQRILRYAQIRRTLNPGRGTAIPRLIRKRDTYRYWDVIRVFRNTGTVRETHR